jgi:hypothetical protein
MLMFSGIRAGIAGCLGVLRALPEIVSAASKEQPKKSHPDPEEICLDPSPFEFEVTVPEKS